MLVNCRMIPCPSILCGTLRARRSSSGLVGSLATRAESTIAVTATYVGSVEAFAASAGSCARAGAATASARSASAKRSFLLLNDDRGIGKTEVVVDASGARQVCHPETVVRTTNEYGW